MSNPQPDRDHTPQGPNLLLVYGLLAFGLLLAAVCAAAIVWPFYHRS